MQDLGWVMVGFGSTENWDGRAVKKLEDVRKGEEEFWGEVSVIGRIYHINLGRTCGFCSEDSNGFLVCEFVENGSLDKVLFDGNTLLGWKERYQIAVGVARGLANLHHEYLEWVIHCVVKPENILLDRNFEPKIADFGLAKLLNRSVIGSNVSRIRRMRRYIAPERATSNLPVTGKINEETNREIKEMKRMCLKLSCHEMGGESWIGSFIDSKLKGDFDCKKAMKMVKVAISCLEEEKNRRPTIEAVVQMLDSGDKRISF